MEEMLFKLVKPEQKHEKPAVCEALARVKDELKGFMEYKALQKARESTHPESKRYDTAAMQEFQHMLMAWDDFVTELKPLLNEEEKAEWGRFVEALR